MVIYKDGRAGLRGPLPPVIHGVLSPERRCRRQMIPGWPSGHGATRCGHFVNGDLSKDVLIVSAMTRPVRGGVAVATYWKILLPLRET